MKKRAKVRKPVTVSAVNGATLYGILILIGYLIISSTLSGCGGVNLRPDPTPAFASDANFHSLEIYLDGNIFLGLAIDGVQEGTALNQVQLSYQAYANGSVRSFLSEPECGELDAQSRYIGSPRIDVPLSGTSTSNCTLGMVMSPDYPAVSLNSVVVGSFKGKARLRKLQPGDVWAGFTSQSAIGSDVQMNWPVEERAGTLYIRGCGVSTNRPMTESGPGNVELSLSSLQIDRSRPMSCVLEGYLNNNHEEPIFSWFIAVYADNFRPLATPALQMQGNKLNVTGESGTTLIVLDNTYKFEQATDFDFDPNAAHTLRLLTVKGRSWLGVYTKETGFNAVTTSRMIRRDLRPIPGIKRTMPREWEYL